MLPGLLDGCQKCIIQCQPHMYTHELLHPGRSGQFTVIKWRVGKLSPCNRLHVHHQDVSACPSDAVFRCGSFFFYKNVSINSLTDLVDAPKNCLKVCNVLSMSSLVRFAPLYKVISWTSFFCSFYTS